METDTKIDLNLKYVQSLIDNKVEEGTTLEFKSAGSFTPSPDKTIEQIKKEIGKDVSALANSAGGLLIYGLKEDKHHQAKEITWIDSKKHKKDWLQSVIESNTSKSVTSLVIHQIQNPECSTEQIYIVEILPSPQAPHMTKDGQYYRRNSQGNVRMEQYEVEAMYHRSHRTELQIVDLPVIHLGEPPFKSRVGPPPSIIHTFNFYIQNIGNAIEHHYKLEIHIDEGVIQRNSTVHCDNLNYRKQRIAEGRAVYSVDGKNTLFQDDICKIATVVIEFDKNRFHYYITGSILLRLFYSNGVKEKKFDLRNLILYKQKEISIEMLEPL